MMLCITTVVSAAQKFTITDANVILSQFGTPTAYDLLGTTIDNPFAGSDLDIFDVTTDTLTITDVAARITKGTFVPNHVTLNYFVYESTGSAGTYLSVPLTFDSSIDRIYSWSTTGQSVNLLDGISARIATYSVDMYIQAIDSNPADLNDGPPITISSLHRIATFSVVPEPSTCAVFAGLSALGLACVLRRRKSI